MFNRFKKLAAGFALASALTGGVATFAPQVGANYGVPNLGSAVPCGYAPSAPNVDEVCSGWLESADPAYVYKVDNSHHIGWWGGNYDAGTWHTIVYLYTSGGSLIRQEANFDVGDDAHPSFNSGSIALHIHPTVQLVPWNAHLRSPMPDYRGCPPGGSIQTTVQDTNNNYGANGWGSGNFWPFLWTSSGNYCQFGSGSHNNFTHPNTGSVGTGSGTFAVQGLTFN